MNCIYWLANQIIGAFIGASIGLPIILQFEAWDLNRRLKR